MARQKSTNPVARVVSAVLLLGIASSVAALLIIGGCFRNSTATPAKPATANIVPSESPAAKSPLADQLAAKQNELLDRQRQREDLLKKHKVELSQRTADLKTGVRGVGLSLDELLTQFQTAPPKTGPSAELYSLYRLCGQQAVHVQRLEEALSVDKKLVLDLQRAEENIRQQAELSEALDPQSRDDALALLEQAGHEDQFNPDTILNDPALTADLETAMQAVQQSLRRRASLLPARPEKAISDLPELPTLSFTATAGAEMALLKQLQKCLADGQAAAAKQLAESRPESAIGDLHAALAKARGELDAFPRSPTWKSDCLKQLDESATALSEQLAAPYLAALAESSTQPVETADWSGMLDLLEEVVRLAPRAAKLPAAVEEIDVLIQWRAKAGDLEAAVAQERFQAIRQQLNMNVVDRSAIQRPNPGAVSVLQAGEPMMFTYKGIQVTLRWCPPGTFRMGSPANETGREDDEGQVNVRFTQGFWIAEVECTQGLWRAITGRTIQQQAALASSSSFYGVGDEFPIYYVSHEECEEACRTLTTELRAAGVLPDGWRIALPTEAQWEYAARAGSTSRFFHGDDDSRLGEYAWYDKNSSGSAHPVGQKKANAWGVKDFSGNLWEWCRDGYDARLPGGDDPLGPATASYRAYRGGDWDNSSAFCRLALRGRHSPGIRFDFLGFRLAAVQEPVK